MTDFKLRKLPYLFRTYCAYNIDITTVTMNFLYKTVRL